MKKHTISLQLIQRFLSEDELKMILEEFHHVETASKYTVFVLLSYLIHAAANDWKSLRHAADVSAHVGQSKAFFAGLNKT